MSLVSDAVLAATGVMHPLPPSPKLLEAASEIPPQFAQRMRALIERNEPHAFKPRLPKRTFDHYFKVLEEQITPEHVTDILDNLGDEVFAGEYLEQLLKARAVLIGAAPANGYTALTGPVTIDLNEYDKSEWWSVILIAEDPDYIGTELEQVTLSVEQVAMMRQVYPDLYAVMVDILNGAIRDKITKSSPFELHPTLEQTFRIFLGMPIDGMLETSAPAEAPAPAQPETEAAQKIKLDRLLPPSGRTEARR